jgi:hypothetical protein
LWINEQFNAAGRFRLPLDKTRPFECQHHLVNGRWADPKIFLHVSFGRRSAVQASIKVNKRQILALLGREGFFQPIHARHPIQPFVRASRSGGTDECSRVELSQTEGDQPTALLSGGKHAARRLKQAQSGRWRRQRGSDCEKRRGGGSTVYRTKRRFVLGNQEAALNEEPRPGAQRQLTGKEEAILVATACSKPLAGRARWTPELLAGELEIEIAVLRSQCLDRRIDSRE